MSLETPQNFKGGSLEIAVIFLTTKEGSMESRTARPLYSRPHYQKKETPWVDSAWPDCPGFLVPAAAGVPTSSARLRNLSLCLRSQRPPTEVKIGKSRKWHFRDTKQSLSWGPSWNHLNSFLGHLIPSLNKDLVLREGIKCPKKPI